jgi:hypothetical protein
VILSIVADDEVVVRWSENWERWISFGCAALVPNLERDGTSVGSCRPSILVQSIDDEGNKVNSETWAERFALHKRHVLGLLWHNLLGTTLVASAAIDASDCEV